LTLSEEAVGEDTPQTYEGTQDIQPGSSLAAYYDPDADLRYCIYQSDKHLYEVSSEGGGKFASLIIYIYMASLPFRPGVTQLVSQQQQQ
jgi:hypothetical protein